MKLTIVAATGGIGRQLLEQAIAAGHDVTAVARNPQNLSPVPARAMAADFASIDPAALQPAVAGTDAVLSALVRPPRLTGKPVTGRYRTAYGQNLRRGVFVSRADVAHYMLSAVDKPETFRQTVGIAR
jgi:uncharacterized protein YbjT (DUF2867 family)